MAGTGGGRQDSSIKIVKITTNTNPALEIENCGTTGALDVKGHEGNWTVDKDGNAVFSSITGVTGIGGVQGETGLQGADGSTGPAGAPQGDTGVQGTTGVEGEQGVTGAGVQGIQGDTGLQGIQGNQGNTGAGIQGGTGLSGGQGPQGIQGNTGAQGLTGDEGATGLQGAEGDQGDQGNEGSTGVRGETGLGGPQGVGGPQGTTGVSNQLIEGETGAQGAQGATGVGASGDIVADTVSATGGITACPATLPTIQPGFVWGKNLPVIGGRVHVFNRNAGDQIEVCCAWNVSSVQFNLGEGQENEALVNFNFHVECPVIKVQPWCPGQYQEGLIGGLGCDELTGGPIQSGAVGTNGVLVANLVRTVTADVPGSNKMNGFVVKFGLLGFAGNLGGSFPYSVVGPTESNPARDLIFDFEVLGCQGTISE